MPFSLKEKRTLNWGAPSAVPSFRSGDTRSANHAADAEDDLTSPDLGLVVACLPTHLSPPFVSHFFPACACSLGPCRALTPDWPPTCLLACACWLGPCHGLFPHLSPHLFPHCPVSLLHLSRCLCPCLWDGDSEA